jgi:hypothetical protein
MNDEIRRSIKEVGEAMAHVHQAFQEYVEELSTQGKDPSEIRQIAKNADTLKDSGHIYMSWARHYAGIGGDEGPTEDIDEDEGRIVDF